MSLPRPVATRKNKILKEPKLTIGLDLGEAGEVILERSPPTTPKRIQQVFSRMPRSRIALETGTHPLWVSQQLT